MKLKILLDSSVYSAKFDSRDEYRQNLTEEFWNTIRNYEIYYSEINIKEANAISESDLRQTMLDLIRSIGKKIDINEDVNYLTNKYISEGLIPEKFENGAQFIALTTVYSLDVLLSWNFKHIVKRKTRIGVNLINLREGYRSIEILAPPEL